MPQPTVVQLTAISGKFGFVLFQGSYLLPFAHWKVPLRGEYLKSNNFNRFPYGIVGVIGGEVTFGGDANVNAAAGMSYAQAPFSLRIQDTPYLISFGWSPTLFLPPVRVLVKGQDFSNDVDAKGLGDYTGEIQGFTNETDPRFYPGDTPL